MKTTDPDHDGVAILHPEYRAALGQLPNFALSDETLAVMRSSIGAMPFSPSGRTTHEDHAVPGGVTVRVHRPVRTTGVLPCIYAIHGGGYVMGSYEILDARFDDWCPRFDCVGVSVSYRLAPEHPFPAGLDDSHAGLAWVHEHAGELGIDPDRIGIQGTSAGGGLAAALAQYERDTGGVPIRFQLLECPMLDDRRVTPSSRLDQLAVWSRESNEYGWKSYLGARYGHDDVPAHAAPARATDLSGLPPAFVGVGGADGFRDEDVAYALRLMQAGVPTELHVYPGAPHGAQIIPGSAVNQQWERDAADWVLRQLATP
ncbi:MAG: alpha/beta hydrolase [Actinomycetes bacterium]